MSLFVIVLFIVALCQYQYYRTFFVSFFGIGLLIVEVCYHILYGGGGRSFIHLTIIQVFSIATSIYC